MRSLTKFSFSALLRTSENAVLRSSQKGRSPNTMSAFLSPTLLFPFGRARNPRSRLRWRSGVGGHPPVHERGRDDGPCAPFQKGEAAFYETASFGRGAPLSKKKALILHPQKVSYSP